jgi:hypothetical protein
LKRDESIELLKKLIPQAPEDRKAEMIFRSRSSTGRSREPTTATRWRTYESAYQSWAESGQTGQPPQRDAFVRQSELIKQNALKLYERVFAEYPRYERNAEVSLLPGL